MDSRESNSTSYKMGSHHNTDPLDTSSNSTTQTTPHDETYHLPLLCIYSVVLVSGLICLSLATHILKSSTTSITSIAVLNLIFTHFLFLLTVPFRIYYYSTHDWTLGLSWCKMVSSMIHIHMYMSFLFYVIILITRLWSFYRKTGQIASVQRLHALLVSGGVWILVLVIAPCVVIYFYGMKEEKQNSPVNQCFMFATNIESTTKVINYIISTVIIVTTAVLTALQANILVVLHKKGGEKCALQQDYSAQVKSMCFALIMVASFIPYHIFRLYYLEKLSLQDINEVLLSLTTFNCLDMLTFLGRRTCFVCSQ